MYLGTIKASTRMILVHVQKMYKTCTEDVQYIKNINRVNGSVKVRTRWGILEFAHSRAIVA